MHRPAVAADVKRGVIDERAQFSERELAAREHLFADFWGKPFARITNHLRCGVSFGRT